MFLLFLLSFLAPNVNASSLHDLDTCLVSVGKKEAWTADRMWVIVRQGKKSYYVLEYERETACSAEWELTKPGEVSSAFFIGATEVPCPYKIERASRDFRDKGVYDCDGGV